MKHFLPKTYQPRGSARRIPSFHAVPVRIRADGWTPLRQAEFIGQLAETRSVAKAARAVSMGRESAYRLRTRPGAEGFNAAWDVALARLGTAKGRARCIAAMEAAQLALRPSRKVTLPHLQWRMETGIWQVILRDGRYCGVRRKADNSALLAVLGRLPGPEVELWP
jgi:hypothetical protein